MPPHLAFLTEPAAITAILVLVGAIYTARSGNKNSLPEHQDRELKRMSSQRAEDRERMDHIEAHNVALSDHVDVLENHIWRGLPPPPPPRPKYTPFKKTQE